MRLALFSLVVLCWAAQARAQVELPAAAKEVLKSYEDQLAELEKKTEAEVKERRDKTAVELKKIQDALCKEAKLDEAIVVRDLIRALQAGNPVTIPEDAPAAAKEVLKQHEQDVAEIPKKAEESIKKQRDAVLVELKKVQDAFCKEAKLDEAVAVRDLIRNLKAGVTNALPDPGYINNAATDIGKVFFYEVTGVKEGQQIYGTDIYTTGSHLGMAAVHCGLLRPGQKGIVKVTILGPQDSYTASTRNGVTSIAYTQWNVSFKVERVFGLVGKATAADSIIPDPGTLTDYRNNTGKSYLFRVTGSVAGSIWGTDVYTDDSNLATAAVHAGLVSSGQIGVVKVTLLPGEAEYSTSTRNGVTSGSWKSWTGSFRLDRAQ
jgi:hypothetical protein